MKIPPILFPMIMLLLISCEKEESKLQQNLPGWLQAQIQKDEKTISNNPKSMPRWGVWVKTQWNEKTYFEYSNLISSSMYFPISFEGDTLVNIVGETSSDYANQKCCAEVVWHGNQIDKDYLKLFHGN